MKAPWSDRYPALTTTVVSYGLLIAIVGGIAFGIYSLVRVLP
jgi:hypothetical protein